MSSHDQTTRVVILGASQAGERLAKKLARRAELEVTVVDMLDERFRSVDQSFALTHEAFIDNAFAPFEAKSSRIIRVHNLIEAVSFDTNTVQVTGRQLHYDLLVVATGMAPAEAFRLGDRKTNPSSREDLLASIDSFKESVYTGEEMRQRLKKRRKAIASAKNGAVVMGSDARAVETACAVKEAFPGVRVVLASRSPRLMPELTEVDSAKLLARVLAKGVQVQLNDQRAAALWNKDDVAVLDCDAPGTPNTQFLPERVLVNGGFVDCDEKMFVRGTNNVLALGKLVNGTKTDETVDRQIKAVAKNIVSKAHNKSATALVGSAKNSSGGILTLSKKVVSVALGSEEFFTIGLAGKIQSKKRIGSRE